ncbi:hypothetical protein B0H17DRAFT_1131256 [Mycena rosella]|uniref:Transmembrane protein n=1 Tax=Mycena rosella TaxID=1033263 RepID=A0AAD7DPC8_MYCRO|nr:hypothetical protein B0H17DRAFT_1150520 [Mycena rosella]KAJ7696106.1 hypothetical protein B0H17DRAFT_1131256 [Mycena rosella]
MDITELLRKLIPSKASIASFIIPFLRHHPNLVVAIKKLDLFVDAVLHVIIHVLVRAAILTALVALVIIPILSALIGDKEETPDAVRPPSNDEESLVPDSATRNGPETPIRGSRDTSLVQGTIAVLMPVIKHSGIAATVVFCLPLSLSSGPTLNNSGSSPTKPSGTTFSGALLSELCKWLRLGLYASAALWFFTNRTVEYFLLRAVINHSLWEKLETSSPSRPYQWLAVLAQFIPLCIAMICNGFIRSASSVVEGFTSAVTTIAGITAGVLTLFLFDVLVYWTYYFWRAAQSKSETVSTTSLAADLMVDTLFGAVVRDINGQTLWDRGKMLVPRNRAVDSAAKSLEIEPETERTNQESKDEKGILTDA